jgi:hypothetical protein
VIGAILFFQKAHLRVPALSLLTMQQTGQLVCRPEKQ